MKGCLRGKGGEIIHSINDHTPLRIAHQPFLECLQITGVGCRTGLEGLNQLGAISGLMIEISVHGKKDGDWDSLTEANGTGCGPRRLIDLFCRNQQRPAVASILPPLLY